MDNNLFRSVKDRDVRGFYYKGNRWDAGHSGVTHYILRREDQYGEEEFYFVIGYNEDFEEIERWNCLSLDGIEFVEMQDK